MGVDRQIGAGEKSLEILFLLRLVDDEIKVRRPLDHRKVGAAADKKFLKKSLPPVIEKRAAEVIGKRGGKDHSRAAEFIAEKGHAGSLMFALEIDDLCDFFAAVVNDVKPEELSCATGTVHICPCHLPPL